MFLQKERRYLRNGEITEADLAGTEPLQNSLACFIFRFLSRPHDVFCGQHHPVLCSRSWRFDCVKAKRSQFGLAVAVGLHRIIANLGRPPGARPCVVGKACHLPVGAAKLAEEVWDDPAHIIVFDRHENNEERWHAIGLVRAVLILTVVHTDPITDKAVEGEERVRIVCARKATRDERKRYEAQND